MSDDCEDYCDDLMDDSYARDDVYDTSNVISYKKEIFANANASITVRTKEDNKIHFLVTQSKGKNYLTYSNQVVFPADPVGVLKQYTEHTSDVYSRVNLSLAADSMTLHEHGYFVNELRAAVIATPLLDNGTLFRGVDLSDIEIDQMEKLGRFFIPSFTSTSVEPDKAYTKRSMLHIKTSYLTKYACSLTSEYSDYHVTEREVLLACYSAFQLEKVEMVNGKKIVTLFLDDFSSSRDEL